MSNIKGDGLQQQETTPSDIPISWQETEVTVHTDSHSHSQKSDKIRLKNDAWSNESPFLLAH